MDEKYICKNCNKVLCVAFIDENGYYTVKSENTILSNEFSIYKGKIIGKFSMQCPFCESENNYN